MRRLELPRLPRKIDILELLRFASILVVLLMVVAFFAGCETTGNEQVESNSTIQKTDSGHEVHGEVRAMYGATAH